jgi:hypothetical protein
MIRVVGKPTSFVDVYRYHVLLKAGDIPYKLQVKDAWGLRSLLSICIDQRKVHIKSLKKKHSKVKHMVLSENRVSHHLMVKSPSSPQKN